MTDEEMAAYICPDDVALGLRAVATYTPERRAVIERMAEVEGELMLWQAGVGKKPEGVIICGKREIRFAREPQANTGRRRRPNDPPRDAPPTSCTG